MSQNTTSLWPTDVTVECIDDVEQPQRNMDLDVELGQSVACGERAPLVRVWRSGRRPGIGVSKKDVATDDGKRAMAGLQADGWDVVVRQTGGTAVPQGEGVLHVSYIFPRRADSASTDAYYRLLCQPLIDWLNTLGVDAYTGALPGSYCDGSYNILVGGRKLVGTAQAWRGGLAGLKSPRPGYIIAHACLTVDVDMEKATEAINRFYAVGGNDYRVQLDTSVTLMDLSPHVFHGLRGGAANAFARDDLVKFYDAYLQRR